MNTENLPESLLEAVAYFADEERAHDFFVAMRWPEGVRCAHCDSDNIGKLSVSNNGKRRVWNCKACKKQFTAKIGTIFAESPLPLSKWLPALWLVTNAKNGISSCELARALKITQKSAWFMGHRIRTAIQRGGGIVRMDGVVEVDETYIGGMARFMHAKVRKQRFGGKTGPTGKTVVMGLLEKHSGKTSRVRAEVLPALTTAALDSRVRKYVLKGAEVHTDENQAYRHLQDDYTHKVVSHAECYVKDGVHTNGLENFWCLLKRSIKGTYVHCAPFHLFRYLDEQTYRFNMRKDEDGDQGRFMDAVKTTTGRRLTWKKLTGENTK
jgi:transposase-like protein